jgi:BirA family transcriptional regulator, biotin operon repressor / biotin---[acetyl-CoA-carboxylase] ligase
MPLDLQSVSSRLPGRRIEWHPEVGSTMTIAAELAREGCDDGTIIGADQQTAGIGRLGRTWDSQADVGLYVSFVLRVPVSAPSVPLTMLALGLAVMEAIEALTSLTIDLRWPNDVLIDGSKCAGILAHWESDAVIAGIGINVSQTSFPPNLDTPATSLLLRGARVRREDLLVEVAESVPRWMELLANDPREVLRRFSQASSYANGRRVRVEQQGRTLEGVTCGLDSSGFLLLREDSGAETTILAGGVRPV